MKSYTDLEQSKKLAEILPLESADMYYALSEDESMNVIYFGKPQGFFDKTQVAWSLAALLGLMPTAIGDYQLIIETESDVYNVSYDDILSGEILILYADFCLFEAIFKMVVWLTKQGHIKVNDY